MDKKRGGAGMNVMDAMMPKSRKYWRFQMSQARPGQTRSGQTRLDQTRPD